jgi:predicted phosphoribosyltransferase
VPFANRFDAGRQLATRLAEYRGRPDVVVVGLPRGGVLVAAEVARELGAPLHAFSVRKIGAPGHEELAVGAIASGGVRVLNRDVVDALDIDPAELERITASAARELAERDHVLNDGRPAPELAGRTVIVVDDGLATGASMLVAVEAIRQHRPARVVVAVPVAPAEACRDVGRVVDEAVCVLTPEPFVAVGLWYRDFRPTSDEEVRALLEQSVARMADTKESAPAVVRARSEKR